MATMIVMQQSLQVKGDDGTMYWFFPGRQYSYSLTSLILNDCVECDVIYQKKLMKHYKVTIDDTFYWIPEYACVEYNKVIEEAKQDKQKHWVDTFADTTYDCIKEAKSVFGLAIDNTYHTDWDNKKYEDAVNATNDQRNIYVTPPVKEISQEKEEG